MLSAVKAGATCLLWRLLKSECACMSSFLQTWSLDNFEMLCAWLDLIFLNRHAFKKLNIHKIIGSCMLDSAYTLPTHENHSRSLVSLGKLGAVASFTTVLLGRKLRDYFWAWCYQTCVWKLNLLRCTLPIKKASLTSFFALLNRWSLLQD